MSAPAMHIEALLFLSKAAPRLTRTSDGTDQLTLLAVHRIAQHQTEPWRLVWTGAQAKDFHDAYAAELTPGRPIRIQAHQLRAHTTGPYTEIVASVDSIACTERETA